jgi:DNA-binding transcriptional MerR regulator
VDAERWTLPDLASEAAQRIAALPAPTNGQIRAVPDERTIRYYATLGLLDRPAAMRGRTALYDQRHLAQVVAIKRLQSIGRSLAEIQALWPTLDDATLARMSGVELPARAAATPARSEFWKRTPEESPAAPVEPAPEPTAHHVELRIELAPNVSLAIAVPDDGIALAPADVRAVRAAAAQLLTELANRRLTAHAGGKE